MFSPDVHGAEVIPSKKFWTGRLANRPVSGVVQHYTASLSERGLVKWMAAESDVSAHIFIFRDGHVVQMVKFSDRALHAGEKAGKGFWQGKPQPANVNHFTIGIENCNVGWVMKKGNRFFLPKKSGTGFIPGTPYSGPTPELASDHLGVERYWEPYTDELVASNIEVMKHIVDLYPNISRDAVCFHSDVSPHRKSDPGPCWPHEYVLSEVFGGDSVPASTVAAGTVEENDDEVANFKEARGDNADGENPEWHYDYDAQMSMIERVDLDTGMCVDE